MVSGPETWTSLPKLLSSKGDGATCPNRSNLVGLVGRHSRIPGGGVLHASWGQSKGAHTRDRHVRRRRSLSAATSPAENSALSRGSDCTKREGAVNAYRHDTLESLGERSGSRDSDTLVPPQRNRRKEEKSDTAASACNPRPRRAGPLRSSSHRNAPTTLTAAGVACRLAHLVWDVCNSAKDSSTALQSGSVANLVRRGAENLTRNGPEAGCTPNASIACI
jgi:hypothetical protein